MLNSKHKKEYKQKKMVKKNGEALYKLMNKAVYGKTIEKLRNQNRFKLVHNKKDYLKWTSKPSYMSSKLFDNELAVIRNN